MLANTRLRVLTGKAWAARTPTGAMTTLAVAITASRVRIALNGQLIAPGEVRAGNGDELAFLPPVSGG